MTKTFVADILEKINKYYLWQCLVSVYIGQLYLILYYMIVLSQIDVFLGSDWMGLFRTLKKNAILALKGSWGRAVVIFLIPAGVSVLFATLQQLALEPLYRRITQSNPTMEASADFYKSIVDFAKLMPTELAIISGFSVLSLFVFAPLTLGVENWYYNITLGKSLPISSIFTFFESSKRYFKSVCYYINIMVRTFLWAIVFYIIPAVLSFLCIYAFQIDRNEISRSMLSLASMGLVLSYILFLLASILYIIYMNKYLITPFLICEDSDIKVRTAIKTSIAYSKGFKASLLLFELSFIGWFILSILTLGILALFVLPYISAANAIFCRYIIERNRYQPPDATKEFVAN